ncbi:MAG: hypothetical protein HPY53_04400 [Brevinematales bacterium]|nr:hypothetical protein [Brevinematales bacterium]
MRKILTLAVLISLLFAAGLYGQEKTKIAVMQLKNTSEYEIDTDALTEWLQTELVNLNEFTVVERSQLDKIIAEQKMSVSGMVSDSDAAKIGQILGASKVITGTVSYWDGKYVISIKGIDATTAVIDYADKVVSQNKNGLIDIMAVLAKRISKLSKGEKPDTAEMQNNTSNPPQTIPADIGPSVAIGAGPTVSSAIESDMSLMGGYTVSVRFPGYFPVGIHLSLTGIYGEFSSVLTLDLYQISATAFYHMPILPNLSFGVFAGISQSFGTFAAKDPFLLVFYFPALDLGYSQTGVDFALELTWRPFSFMTIRFQDRVTVPFLYSISGDFDKLTAGERTSLKVDELKSMLAKRGGFIINHLGVYVDFLF